MHFLHRYRQISLAMLNSNSKNHDANLKNKLIQEINLGQAKILFTNYHLRSLNPNYCNNRLHFNKNKLSDL